MNTIDIYLDTLHENIITEGMIVDLLDKIKNKSSQLQVAFKSKNINAIQQNLPQVKQENFEIIKQKIFTKDPKVKKEYKNNLKKFGVKVGNGIKSIAVFLYTILKFIFDIIAKTGKIAQSVINALGNFIDIIGNILRKLSYTALTMSIILVFISVLGPALLGISTIGSVTIFGIAILSSLVSSFILAFSLLVSFIAFILKTIGTLGKEEKISEEELDKKFIEFQVSV